jgi:hypothetical protein
MIWLSRYFLLHFNRHIRITFSFSGHVCGFSPVTGIHFPFQGLNRTGHDISFTADLLSTGTILFLIYAQPVQKIMDHSAVYNPVKFTGLVVVFYLGKFICLRVVA